MRVALIHMRFYLNGGLETRLYSYMNYFVKRGDEVTIITSKIRPDLPIPEGVKVMQVKLSLVPKAFRNYFFNKQVAAILQRESFDFSLSLERTYAQDYLIGPNTHEGYLRAINKKIRTPKDWHDLKLDRKSYRASKMIFACSDMIRQEIIDFYGVDAEKVKTLYPPLDTFRFCKQGETRMDEARLTYKLNPNKHNLLMVSTGHRRKGVQLMEQVMLRLGDDYQLYIAGSPYQTQTFNIHYIGYVRELEKLYAAMDFTVHPAVYEPFGQIVSESLACGTPVIISSRTGAKEIVDEKDGIVVDSLKVDDWVAAIKQAYEQPFEVPADFCACHQLSLKEHMEKMLSWAGIVHKS